MAAGIGRKSRFNAVNLFVSAFDAPKAAAADDHRFHGLRYRLAPYQCLILSQGFNAVQANDEMLLDPSATATRSAFVVSFSASKWPNDLLRGTTPATEVVFDDDEAPFAIIHTLIMLNNWKITAAVSPIAPET